MRDTTRMALENMKAKYNNNIVPFTCNSSGYNKIETEGISDTTFRKYVKFHYEKKWEEVSIEYIVEQLNSCAGSDCYCDDWEYSVIDGKPHEAYTVLIVDDWGV